MPDVPTILRTDTAWAAGTGRRSSMLARIWLYVEDRILLDIATALMVVAMCVMFYEAASRSLLSESHWWAEELVRFLVVWSVLVAIGVATRHQHFIRMDLVVLMLPAWLQRGLAFVNCLAGLAFSAVLVVAGIEEVVHLHRIGMYTESNLDLQLWQVRLVLPIGGAFYGLYFLGAAITVLRGVDPNQDRVAAADEPGDPA